MRLWLGIAIAVTLGIGCDGPTAHEAAPVLPRHPLVLDDFSILDRYSQVATRPPYNAPCSSEMIEGGLYRAVVFCQQHAAMIVADDRIRAFGWVATDYYASRIKLPAKIGDPIARAFAVWGDSRDTADDTFDLATLHVERFDGVAVLANHGTIVGFVFGDTPIVPSAERWRVFEKLATTTDAR